MTNDVYVLALWMAPGQNGKAQKNERAQALAKEWVKWLRSRRFLGQPLPKHILGLLNGSAGSGPMPDAPMSAEISAFHTGVVSLPETLGRPFLKVYCGFPENAPVKTLAYAEGISARTYYNRAHKGANEALRVMRHTLNLVEHLNMRQSCEASASQNSTSHIHTI